MDRKISFLGDQRPQTWMLHPPGLAMETPQFSWSVRLVPTLSPAHSTILEKRLIHWHL